ncbi:hypothetical protein QLQ75_gp50 [Gordonia phage Santhid]|uniref:Uncharacterized protein n=1 Tax=Gordonia phage Santhid TaxID=2927281 RepID=A0AAE9GPI1_9CAUD|nr:hypothetical protein QLQ75_gp50 [Gordonia phage Santhid]UOK18044.1 hypothetical protein SEA_SANTHID_50 [Gordonia phage Santhid]
MIVAAFLGMIAGALAFVWWLTQRNGHPDEHNTITGTGRPVPPTDPAAALARVEALTYASDDGSEWEHNPRCQGEPDCPACWAAAIRWALNEENRR